MSSTHSCFSQAATNALRHELHDNATTVLALHVAYMDTDMTKDIEAPKAAPTDVAAKALDGLEAGEQEVLADDMSRHVKAALAGPPSALYPPWSEADNQSGLVVL
jgi:short-subunit dehydrogenase